MGLRRVSRDSAPRRSAQDPGLVGLDPSHPIGRVPRGGGTRIDRVIGRVKRVDGDVAVFGHSHALRVLTARWLGLDAGRGLGFILETAAIGVLGWDREFPAVVRWNESTFAIHVEADARPNRR